MQPFEATLQKHGDQLASIDPDVLAEFLEQHTKQRDLLHTNDKRTEATNRFSTIRPQPDEPDEAKERGDADKRRVLDNLNQRKETREHLNDYNQRWLHLLAQTDKRNQVPKSASQPVSTLVTPNPSELAVESEPRMVAIPPG